MEAHVFRIKLTKNFSLLRIDLSLNFYLARQKISRILTEAVGEFRDYNGGIILKQREALNSFREAFPEIALKDPDLLESFYYSLSPIEAQATLPLESLKMLFGLFLEGWSFNFTEPSDYFLKMHRVREQFFMMIRIPDGAFKETIDSILSSSKIIQGIVFSTLNIQNTHFLGYLFTEIEVQTQEELSQSITQALKNWKHKLKNQQVLKLVLEPPVVSLDPRIGGDQISALILKMLFEGLMRINRMGKLEKGLAQSVEVSADKKTYLFKLRPTLWSNGLQVSSYDFEYAWKKILSPTFKTPFAYLFYPIKNAKLAKNGAVPINTIGIQALGELTLHVELEFPAPYFLELTAHSIYSPINHLIDQRHPNWPFEDKESYICNGAFQLKKNTPNEGYELTKNPLYWDAANIQLDQALFLKANRYQSYEMFQKDINHWVGAPLGTWDPSFLPHENDESIFFSDIIVYWFVFNTQQFPLNNKKIRQALALGIDRSKFPALFDVSGAITPIPPVHSQKNHSALSIYDLEKAQALFKEGLKELNLSLQDFPIMPLIYLTGPVRNKVARFIKEQWETAFEIRCTLEALEWKVLFSKMTEGNFQIGGMTWEPWVNDPIYTLNAFRDVKELINFPKWENKQYQEIMHLAEKEIDPQIRKSYFLQAEEILLTEMPVAPIFVVKAPALKKKNFHIECSSPLMNFKWGYFT